MENAFVAGVSEETGAAEDAMAFDATAEDVPVSDVWTEDVFSFVADDGVDVDVVLGEFVLAIIMNTIDTIKYKNADPRVFFFQKINFSGLINARMKNKIATTAKNPKNPLMFFPLSLDVICQDCVIFL